jgi:Uma2 family endonuclease
MKCAFGRPTFPLVPADEYLNTAFHPDIEYVEGVLVERGAPTTLHALLQALFAEYLRKYRKEFGYGVLTECRVQVVRGSRYRIPDVLVCAAPVPRTKTLETVPFVVIEIWSPDDRIGQQMARCREYWDLGVREIVVFEPETSDVFLYQPESLSKVDLQHLTLPDGRRIPFPAAGMLAEFRSELE